MKYFNWQRVHKGALGFRTSSQEDDENGFRNWAGGSLTDLHLQAWSLLCQTCNRYQLDRLSLLAWQYESGKRVP